jgi:hypothetical protein
LTARPASKANYRPTLRLSAEIDEADEGGPTAEAKKERDLDILEKLVY